MIATWIVQHLRCELADPGTSMRDETEPTQPETSQGFGVNWKMGRKRDLLQDSETACNFQGDMASIERTDVEGKIVTRDMLFDKQRLFANLNVRFRRAISTLARTRILPLRRDRAVPPPVTASCKYSVNCSSFSAARSRRSAIFLDLACKETGAC
eukprot:1178933-Prorocentrum_minimum.AAC.5